MDKISENMLNEFASERDLSKVPEDTRFEHFACFLTVSKHYSKTFNTDDLLMGKATGIDSVAIIVNEVLVSDEEDLEQFRDVDDLEITFVFVQADRSSSFDMGKLGNIGYAVADFFNEKPKLKQTDELKDAAAIAAKLYGDISKLKRGSPACRLYYVTTGKWTGDAALEGRRATAVSELLAMNLFRDVTFEPMGADGIQKRYRQIKSAIQREFVFRDQVVLPDVPNVSDAYIGFIPAPEFFKIISDENGEIVSSLFYNNPRDWQDYNKVNSEMRETLKSDAKNRFVLMNNGVTVIARNIKRTGHKFYIEDFQVVNGCQTTHVLFQNAGKTDESVKLPLRLIGTQDEGIINSIIRATNRQTPVTEEEFFALEEFPKQLEEFFQTFPPQKQLFIERRSGQYERTKVEKTRIVIQPNVIKAFAAMFLAEAHRTTRSYSTLKAKVGKEIFAKGHKMEPYYTAAFALYRLEYLFRNKVVEAKYKPARFHILLAARLISTTDPIPPINSREMEKYCQPIMETLWDQKRGQELLQKAVTVVEEIASGNFDRDKIRTDAFTRAVLSRFSVRRGDGLSPHLGRDGKPRRS